MRTTSIFAVLFSLLAGCESAAPRRITDPPPIDTVSVDDGAPKVPVRATQPCVITRITDGDTIECATLGRVRFIGIDTPELSQSPFGAQSTAALAGMIAVGDTVRLEPDVELRDAYSRLLMYVWTDDGMVNWRMMRGGWSVTLTYPPNVQYVDAFAAAQQLARSEELGLWSTGGFDCLPAQHRSGAC